jgi:hypothetical protein
MNFGYIGISHQRITDSKLAPAFNMKTRQFPNKYNFIETAMLQYMADFLEEELLHYNYSSSNGLLYEVIPTVSLPSSQKIHKSFTTNTYQ